MDQRLSLITLGVDDLKRSYEFYVKGLGWRPSTASNEHVCFIQLNGMALGLYSREALAEDAQLPNERSAFGGITLAYNARSREEVDAVLVQAKALGAKILKPAQDVFWGGYSGYFADPDGHPWEVAWNPGFTLDSKGNLILP
jgi:catechol 2,3-dioxygenase-like lactoylglutathione lyase family enzyme